MQTRIRTEKMKTINKRLEALETRKRPGAYVDVIKAREDFILPVLRATCGSGCNERTDECIRWWDCSRLWDAVEAATSQLDKNDPRARAQKTGIDAWKHKRELWAIHKRKLA
jgi:hypothetical protein